MFAVGLNGKNIINVSPPYERYPLLGTQELLFQFPHKEVLLRWSHSGSHCRTMYVQIIFLVKSK